MLSFVSTLHGRRAAWLSGCGEHLARCGSRTEPHVADQAQPLLRSEVQARWRSAVAADGCAAQMDGLPVPTSGNRATAAAPLAAATGSGGGSSDTDSEQEEVPDMAAALIQPAAQRSPNTAQHAYPHQRPQRPHYS